MKDHTFKLCVGLAAVLMAMTPAYAMPSFLNTIMSFVDANPEITTAYLDKTKYQLGDQMLITAVVSDDWGIERVQAQIEKENGWDTLDMIVLAGNSRKATWQGVWKVHDTLGVKEYTTKIIATDLSGKTAEKILVWIDPIQSHPTNQINPGAFQDGSYKFPGNLGIGADATAGDRLKVKATSGNAINAECTNCDAIYSNSSAGYSGYFTGGLGVRINSGGLTVSAGTVSLPNGQIGTSEIEDSAVTTTKILDGTIATTDIADGAVTSAKVSFNYAGSGSKGGVATTAAALSANGANCGAGQYAQGVDASGNAEGCTSVGGAGTGWVWANCITACAYCSFPSCTATATCPSGSVAIRCVYGEQLSSAYYYMSDCNAYSFPSWPSLSDDSSCGQVIVGETTPVATYSRSFQTNGWSSSCPNWHDKKRGVVGVLCVG